MCFWEDDGGWELDEVSGPNGMTLREGRRSFDRIGACSADMLGTVRPDAREKFVRRESE